MHWPSPHALESSPEWRRAKACQRRRTSISRSSRVMERVVKGGRAGQTLSLDIAPWDFEAMQCPLSRDPKNKPPREGRFAW